MKTLTNSHYKYKGYMDTHALYALMESKLPWDFTLSYGVRQTWVRHYNDMLLVNTRTGTVVRVIPNFYW